MLQTIQVEIDATGHTHPMESLSFKPVSRALLTLLDTPTETMSLLIYLTRSRLRIFQIAEILDLEDFSLVL